MRRKLIFLALLLFLCPVFLSAQIRTSPKIQIGIQGGAFRISIDQFDRYYGNRFAFPVGAQIGYAISPSFQVMVRGKYFQKNHDYRDPETGQTRERIWEQTWLELGIQQYSISFSGTSRTFLGFGLAFFFINEKKDGDFLQQLGYRERSTRPRGFYICVGYDHLIGERVTFSFEIELTSAGVKEGAGLAAQSVGGIFVGLGANLLLF